MRSTLDRLALSVVAVSMVGVPSAPAATGLSGAPSGPFLSAPATALPSERVLPSLPVPAGATCRNGSLILPGKAQVAFQVSPLGGCGPEGTVAPSAPARGEPLRGGSTHAGPADCLVPTYDDRCEAWASAPYDGEAAGPDVPYAVLSTRTIGTSPDGTVVFVAAASDAAPGGQTDWDSVTISYDGETGEQGWLETFPGSGERDTALSHALAVAPDGETVYTLVDISSQAAGSSPVILAHDTRSGGRRWIHAPGRRATVMDLAVAPDGARLYYGYTAGVEVDGKTRAGMSVAAVDTATGEQVWESVYPGETELGAAGWIVEPSPDGSKVFLAGGQQGESGLRADFTTVAFEAADPERLGEILWVARDEVTQPDHGTNGPLDVVASPDSSRVFVTGIDRVDLPPQAGPFSLYDESALLTYAHDAATGERLWKGRYAGSDLVSHDAWFNGTLAVSPDGARVFVTGLQGRAWENSRGWAVVAYETASGERAWAVDSRDNQNISKLLFTPWPSIAATEDQVFVTGYRGAYQAWEYGTAAYDAATGDQQWMARFTRGRSIPAGLVASPDGGRLFVTGYGRLPGVSAILVGASVPGDSFDIQTVAYEMAG